MITLKKIQNLIQSIKNRKFKKWFYEFKNGHPFLICEEADIIFKTRLDDRYGFLNDKEIMILIESKIDKMYKEKYPNAKRWTMTIGELNKDKK